MKQKSMDSLEAQKAQKTKLFSFQKQDEPKTADQKPVKLFTFLSPAATDQSVAKFSLTAPPVPPLGPPKLFLAPAPSTASAADPFMTSLAAQKKAHESQQESDLFKSLIKTEEKTVSKKRSVLGELPKIDTSLFIDREYHLKKQLSLVRFIFAFLLVAFFGGFVYFYTQLESGFDLFGPNVSQKLDDKNLQLKNLQTEVNLYRTQSAKVMLDSFTYLADSFLQKVNEYQVAQTDGKKAEILADTAEIRENMYEPFEKAREKLLAQNWTLLFHTEEVSAADAEREFEKFLKERLRTERREKLDALKKTQQILLKEQLQAELLQNFELMQLIGNLELKRLLQTDIRETSNDQLKEFLFDLSRAYPNRLGFVYQIKQKRIPWARTIREISEKTKSIDPLFRTGFFQKLGGILYTAFDFEAAAGRIGLSGHAKSDDGTNFSILANLIDELEGSPLFQEVDMRSFSKRFSEDGYEGSFRIDFLLQTELVHSKDKQYRLDAQLPAQQEAIKRILRGPEGPEREPAG